MGGGLGTFRPCVTGLSVFATSVASCVFPAGVANSDPQAMPDRWTQFVTDDGWVVDVNTTNEVINHIDNLAGGLQLVAGPRHAALRSASEWFW